MSTRKTSAKKPAPAKETAKQQRDDRQIEELDMPDNDRMAPDRDLPTDDPDIMGGTVP